MARILRRLVLTLLFATSVTAWAGYIRGQVRYQNGEYAARVVVRLRSDVVAYETETQTDPEGKFTFNGLPLTTYYVIIEGQGFRPYRNHIDISGSKIAYELITLLPDKAPEAKAVPPEGPAGVLNARLAQMPPHALKEFSIGERLLHQKKPDLEASARHLRKAIKAYETFPEAYLILGLVYMDQSKFADSQSALQRSLELDPKSSAGYVALGTLFNQTGAYSEAERALTHGLELKPDDAEGQCELARTYLAMGRWQEAEPHAQKAVAFMPQLAPAHVVLGNVALRKHDSAAALREFKEYLRLAPEGAMAAPTRQVIAQIEGANQAGAQKQ